jgi:hypothetical protein
VNTRLPAKFEDLEARAREEERERLTRQVQELTQQVLDRRTPEAGKSLHPNRLLSKALVDLARILPFGSLLASSYKVAQYATASQVGGATKLSHDLVTADAIDAIRAKVDDASADAADIERTIFEEAKQRLADINVARQAPVLLQPGNSTVQAFTLRTTQAIFFVPSSYNLNIQIEYEIDGLTNQDSIAYRLDVRAPIKALITGSVLGSAMGYLIKDIYDRRALVALLRGGTPAEVVSWSVALIGAVLLGVLLVIAFARKKDTQPLISIEDFWGGVFVGFVAGYLGSGVLNQVLPGPVVDGAAVPPN